MFRKANPGFDKNAPIRRPGAAAGNRVENGRNREEFVAFELTTIFQGQIWFITKTYLRFTNYVTDTLKYNIKSIPKQSSPGVPRKGLERRSAPDRHLEG